MKKRIVCVLLTLIMLMSLVPVSAFAAGRAVSESAITILKQLEGYTTYCGGKGQTFGYGTICTDNGKHNYHSEKEADNALRKALAELDKAVNSFAAKKGISLTQGKHDALVLFSFENGTAWTTGTGDLQAAVASGKTGDEFLNVICRWDESTADDTRRMIEANMYLNGVYSSARPSNYIRVRYDANGGSLNGNTEYQYYNVSGNPAPHLVPTMDAFHTFTGWYVPDAVSTEHKSQVTKLTAAHHGVTLTASWVETFGYPGDNTVRYAFPKAQLAGITLYEYNTVKASFEKVSKKTAADYYIDNILYVDSQHVDEKGTKWCRIEGTSYWVKMLGAGSNATAGVDETNVAYIDVTVTVTNSYVRMRVNASTASKQNGSYSKGDKLRIINTANGSGYLWGQVATSATDNTPIGWVALMYTNFESVRDSGTASAPATNASAVVAKAVITYPGYVNVRSEAGTHNQIVSALPFGTEVSLTETKYVNGQEWGRCSAGWICLNYASVERLVANNSYKNDVGFTSYVFTGVVDGNVDLYENAGDATPIFRRTRAMLDGEALSGNQFRVTITNLTNVGGITWGKIKEGWIKVSNADGTIADANLDDAKYLVSADSLTARKNPGTDAERLDVLVKNVEFNVNVDMGSYLQVVVLGDSVWGYASKVGEANKTYGWVNLANKNVTRNGTPTVETSSSTAAAEVMMATIINTNSVKVRITGATYGKQIGTLPMGTRAAVLEESNGWYNLDIDVDGNPETGSWVSGKYLDIALGTVGGNSTSSGAANSTTGTTGAVETGLGVVANTYSGVNVRAGAGTGYASNGKLLPGTTVEILEVVTKGASKWGRTAQGWVCMDYVTMISKYAVSSNAANAVSGSTGSTNVTSTVAIYTGAANGTVNVLKTTSLDADVVHTLDDGDPVTMHEIVSVVEEKKTGDDNSGITYEKKTSYWARVNDGYIYNPSQYIRLDTLDENVYTVTGAETLNVRDAAGVDYGTRTFQLKKGAQVNITKLQIVKNEIWGFMECDEDDRVYDAELNSSERSGWVSLAYMTKGAITIASTNNNTNTNNGSVNTNTGNGTVNGGTTVTTPVIGNGSSVGGFVTNTSGYRYTGKVIRTNSLNVRATASDTAAKTTTLSNGQAMVIYETTTVNGMAWGRCDAGWVYLYYVDLTPVTGAVDARVVANENTIIYTDMNGSATAGTYAKQSVVDIYEIVGKMARTELGWINTDNLL